jgi:hypothetical protein
MLGGTDMVVDRSSVDSVIALLRETLFPPDAALLSEVEAELLDGSRPERDRLLVLERLAGILSRSEDRQLSDAAINGLITLASTASDPDVRSNVWGALSAETDQRLLQPLADALLYDPSEQVRFVAVVALEAYASDFARSVLAAAGRNDESAAVRENASWAALDDAGRRERVASALLNGQLSVEERLAPLEQAILPGPGGNGMADLETVVDASVATAIGELLGAIDEPRRRVNLLNQLAPFRIPALTPVLIARLHDDADENVRITAVHGLQPYLDEPGARQALETAAANDSSETVRWQARNALETPPPVQ